MRIAILTQPLRFNYGGILQNYALQQILKKMGHQVVTLDPSRYHKQSKLPYYFLRHCFTRYLKRVPIDILVEYHRDVEVKTKGHHTFPFIDRYINRIEIRNTSDILERAFDCLLVGSDQVWRPKYNIGRLDDMFLSFANTWNVKRIAYAASFGSEQWEMNEVQTEKCAKLIQLFDSVSVRESSAVGLCQKYLHKEAVLVLDPTLLLDFSDYLKLIPNYNSNTENNILATYILDQSDLADGFVQQVSHALHLNIKPLCSKFDDPNAPIEQRIQPPIEHWLKGILDAKFVITDSFHGTVFCIIFNKPFLTIANSQRGIARFKSLLQLFNLENRLIIDNHSDDFNHFYFESIEWNEVNKKKEALQHHSLHYLTECLN